MRYSDLQKIRQRLSSFVSSFSSELGRSDRHRCCHYYLSGLLLDGERKSIQPMSELLRDCSYDSLQNFVTDSPWNYVSIMQKLFKKATSVLKLNDGVLILDDTTFPKKGNHSVGVARQYCGASGKIDNCQTLVSWQFAHKNLHIPVISKVYLPESWCNNKEKMDKAKIPENDRVFKEKWQIALDLLDKIDRPSHTLLFDAGYGSNRKFLKELDIKGYHYVGQIRGTETFFDGDVPIDRSKSSPTGRGRCRKHLHLADHRFKPKSAKKWSDELFKDPKNVKTYTLKTNKPKKHRYVAKRVFEAVARPFHCVGSERWLIIEELSNGEKKFFISNYHRSRSPRSLLLLGHERWKIEQGYQQLKEELGLDHYEGRSWQGFHHHIALCFMAFVFLVLELKKNL